MPSDICQIALGGSAEDCDCRDCRDYRYEQDELDREMYGDDDYVPGG